MKYFISLLFLSTVLFGQKNIPQDTAFVKQATVTINGKNYSYSVETGFQPVWNEKNKAVATLHYTYYTLNTNDPKGERPLLISFNGGPGSGSVWMHLAYTGPKILNIDDEGNPIQPYGVKDNPNSVLDIADIVYVNPVNTGYSRPITDEDGNYDRNYFFGINADINYLARWLNTFVTRKNKWRNPKYLIGESYGGTRVAGLAHRLQSTHWMYLNGVIMVSPANYQVLSDAEILLHTTNLPYFTAAAWYHKQLPPELQSKDLLEILPEVEQFTLNTYLPALAKGGFLPDTERKLMAKELAKRTGLEPKFIEQNNLRVNNAAFWKELLKNESGFSIGRLDSRYLGLDKTEAGSAPDYNAELISWLHSFTPAVNYYFNEELGLKIDHAYHMFGDVRPWDRRNDNTQEQLRQALAQNPYLHILYQTGYYDGATTYFQTKYSMQNLDPSGKLKERLSFKGYRSGHMMYLRAEDLKNANQDVREFILKTSKKGTAAKY
ncbi:MAG: carboxypeptidase [Flavobacteriaceae bacterium]|nr:carboxypeptidase [Flavobacteriaceae bacterium]